jgi:hypothetical protein
MRSRRVSRGPLLYYPHLLFGIDDASIVMPERQKMVLHEAARFDPARLVVIAFDRRSGAMTEQTGGNTNVGRVVDRDACGSAISK